MDANQMVKAIKEIREETGLGIMEIRKALDIHKWNKEDAIEHMRVDGNLVARPSGSLLSCGCRTK